MNVSRMWRNPLFARSVGATYDWAMARPAVARRFGRLVMGADVDRLYRVMDPIAEIADDAAVLDVPCGSGIAMLRMRPDQRSRYVGLDFSPTMLARARRRIPTGKREFVEFVEGDAERMPFGDGEFDLCVCVNGLHCLPRPSVAVREIARCLRPGGRLVGEFATRGQLARADAYMAVLRATGTFGPAGSREDAQRWFGDAGFEIDVLECTGAITHFDVHLPG